MPSLIKYDGVYWHSNGELCRNSNVLNTELPCNIDRVTNMTFCKSKNDSQEHVKYPISVKYYGDAVKSNLRYYEKYVSWPIRDYDFVIFSGYIYFYEKTIRIFKSIWDVNSCIIII